MVPENAESESVRFHSEQKHLIGDGREIDAFMAELERKLAPQGIDPDQLPVSMLQEPRLLMGEAIEAQERAAGQLRQWASWPEARVQQQVALDRIQAILDMLASDQSGDGDDWDESDEESEDMEYTESDASMSSSREGQGDFAASAEMQELPVPNYSVQDILREEQGSLQFRQQQRAARNQGKVEKDW